MISETPFSTPAEPAGERLLFIIAAAVIGVVIAEAAFVAVGGMVLMVATVALALAVTGGVIYAVGRTIGSEDHE
jgi:type IV secretory pathway VirB3-like protein